MSESKTVEIIKPNRLGIPVGTITSFDMPDIANQLVLNGKAKYVDPPTPEIKFKDQQRKNR